MKFRFKKTDLRSIYHDKYIIDASNTTYRLDYSFELEKYIIYDLQMKYVSERTFQHIHELVTKYGAKISDKIPESKE